MKPLKLLVSLHDVTPFHFARLQKAEALCDALGIRKLSLLLIPNYHGGYCSTQSPEFVAWCRRERSFAVQWQLHGHHHLEPAGLRAPARLSRDRLKRRFLTAGEGEFLALDPHEQRRRLQAGRAVFRQCLGQEPAGFVAPAWLFNSALLPLLRECGFRYTEDRHRIFSLTTGQQMRCPVITWATRTRLRKGGSLLACRALSRLWRHEPVLRVAIHPFDFDHPETRASIERVLGGLARQRHQVFAEELEWR